MSHQAEKGFPEVIDALAFAREGAAVVGMVEVAALTRLMEVLADNGGHLRCKVAGYRDGEGNSWLTLGISGSVTLVCQRCLATLPFPVDVATRLMLVGPGQPWPDEELVDDGYDAVAAEKEMSLLALIEDEVLLALPIAPMHDTCSAPMSLDEEFEPSPFSVLAKFKKGV
jgi:uncharacterized protein